MLGLDGANLLLLMLLLRRIMLNHCMTRVGIYNKLGHIEVEKLLYAFLPMSYRRSPAIC